MPLLNELADTYLTACEVEGKARSTIRGYRQSISRLQEVGTLLEFPATVEAFTVQHVYAFLGTLREQGVTPRLVERLAQSGMPHHKAKAAVHDAVYELARVEHRAFISLIKGDEYQTLWTARR